MELPAAAECCGFGGTFAVKNAGTQVHEFVVVKTDLKADALPVVDDKIDESTLTPVDKIEDIAAAATPTPRGSRPGQSRPEAPRCRRRLRSNKLRRVIARQPRSSPASTDSASDSRVHTGFPPDAIRPTTASRSDPITSSRS